MISTAEFALEAKLRMAPQLNESCFLEIVPAGIVENASVEIEPPHW